MYRQAIKTYKENFSQVLLFAILLAIVPFFISTTTSYVDVIVVLFIAFYAHRNILVGEKMSFASNFKRNPNKDANPQWRFIWRFLILSFGPAIPSVLLTLALFSGHFDKGAFIGVFMVSYSLFMAISLSLFGLVLPAASTQASLSFSDAFKLSKPKFWSTLWSLFYGPFAVTLLNTAIIILLAALFADIPEGTPMHMVFEFGISVIATAISAFSTILVATVLSLLYMNSVEL